MNNIVLLGLVSFFSDISSEMVYPIIPLYLVNAFGAAPSVVGLIEGIAESLAGILKVFGGRIADKTNRKKPLAFAGYSAGLIYKTALVFARSWPGVLVSRVVDRFGKGIRTAPRDVLVAESANRGSLGKAFGDGPRGGARAVFHDEREPAGRCSGSTANYVIRRG